MWAEQKSKEQGQGLCLSFLSFSALLTDLNLFIIFSELNSRLFIYD